jgi:hypothetical protein
MGFYIQVPNNKNKAQQLCDIHGGTIIEEPKTFNDIPLDKGLVCVVENGYFDAAALCYNEKEFEEFRAPDGYSVQRKRTWVLLDNELAKSLSGYRRS